MKKNNLAVIAIGNELMGDDGVGPVILKILSEKDIPESVDLIDGGTGGISLLHIVKNYGKVIFIDCADFGGAPGEIRVFTPLEINSVKEMRRYSLHEVDLMEVIRLSQKIGEAPEHILLIAVQPKRVNMNMRLSLEVATAIPQAVKEVISQIKK